MERIQGRVLYKKQMQVTHMFIMATLLFSCKQDQPSVKLFKTQDSIVADTANRASAFLSFHNSYHDYPIYYIGKKVDTIKIGKCYWRGRTHWVDDFKTRCSRKYSSKTLNIFVDTTAKTNSPVEYFSDNEKTANDSTINYNSFLFYVQNISDSTIYLGRTFSLYFMNREAKDKHGNWIKIDKKLSELGICGTGEPTIILKPNELIISKVKRFSGSFSTDCRLVFGYNNNFVYSNIFRDAVDERAF